MILRDSGSPSKKQAGRILFGVALGMILTLMFCTLFRTPGTISEKSREVRVVAPALEVATSSTESTVLVTRVIDGDTIELVGGVRVRYIGVNTPETVDPRKPVQCFGKEASDRNKELVEGKYVRLVKDVSETDRYGRLLRYVYVGDTFANLALVEGGFAHSSTYPPDVREQEKFRVAEESARIAKKGLWGEVCTDNGDEELTPVTKTEITAPDPSCMIKGNISSGGNIYHVPGCESYDKTSINESSGERWFCSEDEAVNAGWRKAKNCL